MDKSIYSSSHKNLVERLRLTRQNLHLTQKEVAKLLGKTQSYISKIESGQRRIDIIQLKELAGINKKNINYFINT